MIPQLTTQFLAMSALYVYHKMATAARIPNNGFHNHTRTLVGTKKNLVNGYHYQSRAGVAKNPIQSRGTNISKWLGLG